MATGAGASPATMTSVSEELDEAQLPVKLLGDHLVPPVPNGTANSVDWLRDFAGFSWLAYGASSLAVVTHAASPLSSRESAGGSFFHQVLEPDPPPGHADPSVFTVRALSWSPSLPSDGALAVSLANCVSLYSPTPDCPSGPSFRWRPIARLVQSCEVEAIAWTRSGDGLITAGVEVVVWKKKNTLWEVLGKSHVQPPQTLVSAAWSIHGPIATAAAGVASKLLPNENPSFLEKAITKALVWKANERSGFVKAELHHPQPVSMIQWRPLCYEKISSTCREVLLTCCMDGVVRLWTEIDDGRGRKHAKEAVDHKRSILHFCVTAVIEINQWLGGFLGTNTFVVWANEIGGRSGEDELFRPKENLYHDEVGRCEWLAVVGPGASLALWAVHCLDDTSPLRCPRLRLWKKVNISDLSPTCASFLSTSDSLNSAVLVAAVISRNTLSGPPASCSLLQLLPNSSFMWLHMDRLSSAPLEQIGSDSCASVSSYNVSTQDGHTGNIIQFAVHPCSFEIDIAASLDSNGYILLWSLFASSSIYPSKPTLFRAALKCVGRIPFDYHHSGIKYSSLSWGPLLFNGNMILLVGHAGGIDCLIIRLTKDDGFAQYRICTLPYSIPDIEEGPEYIHAYPLPSVHLNNGTSTSFMFIGVWMGPFRAVSWRFDLHSNDSVTVSSQFTRCIGNSASDKESTYKFSFSGANYCIHLGQCSSAFSDHDESHIITSVAFVSIGGAPTLSSPQNGDSLTTCADSTSAFHMAAGCSNGSVKLYKMLHHSDFRASSSKMLNLLWQLVGMFRVDDGPVGLISLCSGSSLIATVSRSTPDGSSCLHIWDSINLIDRGCFLLEDQICFGDTINALDWVNVGNGQSLLTVCLLNELRIYARKRFNAWEPTRSRFPLNMQNWICVAHICTLPSVRNFLWGPKLTVFQLHQKYIRVINQWSFTTNEEGHNARFYPEYFVGHHAGWGDKANQDCHHPHDCVAKKEMHSIFDVVEKCCGSLPLYHPKALISCLLSGQWKRAYAVVGHLITFLGGEDAKIIQGLHEKTVAFHSDIQQIKLSEYLKISCSRSLHTMESQSQEAKSTFISSVYNDRILVPSVESEIKRFARILENSSHIPGVTNIERTQILAIVDLLVEISDLTGLMAYESFDEPARRFWVAVRFEQFHFQRKFGRSAVAEELAVDSRSIAWAFQSDSHENLINSVLSHEPSWQEMRNLGVGFWFTNVTALRAKMENLARVQYLKNRDPKDCALLYLALNRIKVLAGLFKLSKDQKDKPLFGFLCRDFQVEKNKAAALKNAYVLMGRHQLALAIAFFLLGGDHSSAVTVCAKNLGDAQLAIVICRLLEGYGGQLERNLIATHILPTSIEKGDYWLASVLEWMMGNYSQSCLCLLDDVPSDSKLQKLDISGIHRATSDPSIGQYCAILATKNCLRNSLGDAKSSVLGRWAMLMASFALTRCGLPFHALDCISSWSNVQGKNQEKVSSVGRSNSVYGILKPIVHDDSCNWLSGDVTSRLESCMKLNLGMQYISKFMVEHLCREKTSLSSSVAEHSFDIKLGTRHHEELVNALCCNIQDGISTLEKEHLLNPSRMLTRILIFACNTGKLFLGYHIMHTYVSSVDLHQEPCGAENFRFNGFIPKATAHAFEEICHGFAHCIIASGLMASVMKTGIRITESYDKIKCPSPWEYHLQDLLQSVLYLRCLLKFSVKTTKPVGLEFRRLSDLDCLTYCIYFALAWSYQNVKLLLLMIETMSESKSVIDLQNLVNQTVQVMPQEDHYDSSNETLETEHSQSLDTAKISTSSILPEDEKCLLLGVCLWQNLFMFTASQLYNSLVVCDDEKSLHSLTGSESSSLRSCKLNKVDSLEKIESFPFFLAEPLVGAIAYILSGLTKELIFFVGHKLKKNIPVFTLTWLRDLHCVQPRAYERGTEVPKGTSAEVPLPEKLWEIVVKPKEVSKIFSHEGINFETFKKTKSKGWKTIQDDVAGRVGGKDTVPDYESANGSAASIAMYNNCSPSYTENVQGSLHTSSHPLRDRLCMSDKEILRRTGELLEAICVNSCDEKQIAVASNRKGLLFFRWSPEETQGGKTEYIWQESDWPHNGWAGSESTPLPTFVSPGVGLGSKKGTHLGLGGATVGVSSLARPGRDLTGGGAFGIPGYAGIGASGLGWGEQEDFEEFVDPPATVENIRTRALSSHPCRPLFLAGSTNTHVYLWEFDKSKATATYGILPAANVPPPYALASISALRFDHFGHRFASAASDGTVCTWQLEVGGRSNVRPTESSVCFQGHACDVTYLGTSGSILVAAGSNSNNANVVVWDTLAPPATSRVSLRCHEGGARSVAISDHDVGSGSVSPLIVTGGKGGDVGVHDFRFIATGKSKRNRIPKESNHNLSKPFDTETDSSLSFGDHNSNGMLWYLPKAHLGSITRISTIPNTSLFLTGSKDGDIKLWDAKRSELVFHWPKMHDRHTFFQPSSRSFGGVVRAAVTDIQTISNGFLTCGGDGVVRLVQIGDV